MNVNCRTNYKKCPFNVKNNGQNEKKSDLFYEAGLSGISFMFFLQCYMVKMPDFIDILLDGSVGCELA